ncbi:MAG: FkbM family methyltransferase [Epsilonproteobacteria bacterium]|nr:FkbM family methyltransferase [Campylobacterota bacterium]OIO16009.1 MAG: methyltransferase [Helicobacteraceae bacterium CG1_02_36_14]PIP11369.1 MAG: methyltransferase [Sulfurimonas sp. CG23_combo_of_CG06-09_8_20_14_all_36_33]PIS23771.1 MAG: FkbM family methyltransferase [Sulfurimonas sp. CG08_land_8_20_14_0_20_36_33]PIU34747.1 MAG: FkbM family methyltransferase [Sulfurimonas sp. CG07_land_8_20_14_0_80_36_56]PIV05794.1 MAG: FkbM family methyltransferase [Sulfurimonas sp. CG03_land_8_20_14_0
MQLVDFDYINQNEEALTQRFLSCKSVKKYILGINKLTKSVLRHVEVDGIIDDFSRVQRSRKKEILQIEDVPKDSIVLWVATGSPLEVKKRLDAMGLKNISYLAFYRYSKLDLAEPPFILDFKEDFQNNRAQYEATYKLLGDEKSKEVFIKVLNFKISFDYNFMEGFTNDHAGQYFEKELIGEIEGIRFVDGGGYVGDTCTEVVKNFPDFEKIYLIEPIAENIRIAKRELGHYENIEFLACGISNKQATLHFNEEKSFSTLYGTGTQSIEVNTIDALVKERVDFIKLDIEGAEQDAIDGAKETIQKYKPILAVCIYHRAEDWYKIPQKVLALESGYKLYLRHYMEGIFESVMYFIPEK